MKRTQFLFILCILLFQSCFKSEVRSQFDIAESMLQSRPDSCLHITESIDRNTLTTNREAALYALLMTAAQDKNGVELQSDSLIKVAVDYYSNSKDLKHRMMAYYYYGLALNNAESYLSAIVALEKAERDALTLNDRLYSGLIYRAKGDVFTKTNNNPSAIESMQKAVCQFEADPGLTLYARYARVSLAICYINNKDYDLALEELNTLQKAGVAEDSNLSEICAVLKGVVLVDSDKELKEAVKAFESSQNNKLGINETGLLAVAYEKTGNSKSADEQLLNAYSRCRNQADSATVDYMHAEILHNRGNDAEAYRLTRKASFVQDSLTRVLLQQSVSNAQRDYYKAEAQMQEERALRIKERSIFGATAGLFALVLLSGASVVNRRRKDQEIKEQMLRLSISQSKLQQAEQTNASLLGSLFSEKLNHLDKISDDYVQAESDQERDSALKQFRAEIASMREDEDLFRSLEKDLDRYCDGVMGKLREQVPSIKGENLKLISLFFAGLPYSTVMLVMNRPSVESLKTARSRFRREIRAAGAVDEALFLKRLEMRSGRSAV